MPKFAPGMAIIVPSTAKITQASQNLPQIGVPVVILDDQRHVKSGPGVPKLALYWCTYGDLLDQEAWQKLHKHAKIASDWCFGC